MVLLYIFGVGKACVRMSGGGDGGGGGGTEFFCFLFMMQKVFIV